ncbi:MmcQ/YjbR family DNA-binding protein [Acuticoccus mangrovi]|uniref:MmcQ/YjbR family DNA-binding protein n=1 Tax=Acuticoccus mangrovi TaxID=2796142 RepID=A0A934MGI5_9HYPH|nr:MmcQ/YjbR family DNA-binding protein [Acuticoccus mangrovi]MBJ3775016.1 MmcQ/YjbR family DNA-binding protein [Acuticoccus mangrovi]
MPAARLETICLALPEATLVPAFGGITYRVRNRIFAMPREREGRPAVWLKAPPGSQEILTGADPDRFFRPPYVGPKGWVGMMLDADCDFEEVAVLVRRSYRLIAPKRLGALVEG